MNTITKILEIETGSKYLYDRNVNAFARISENESNLRIGQRDDKHYKKLKSLGFFKNSLLKEIKHPETEFVEELLNNKIEGVTLQVTQNCNLACSYCPYSGSYNNRIHKNARMSYSIAQKSIDYLLANSSQQERVAIGFYGGEPLLEFGLIKEVIDYANYILKEKTIHYSITTNGTIISPEIIDFFCENEVNLIISIDGPEDVHNQNRCFSNGLGSHSKIISNLNKIKSCNLDYYNKKVRFNTVLNPDCNSSCVFEYFASAEEFEYDKNLISNLSDFYSDKEIVYSNEYMYSYYNSLLFSFLEEVSLVKTNLQCNKQVDDYKRQLFKEFDNGLVFDEKLPEVYHHGGPCIPGLSRLFIDVQGKFFPCERVSELSNVMNIGSLNDGFDYDKVKMILNVGKISEERCKECWAIRHCKICAAAADNLDYLCDKKKSKHCEMMKNSLSEMMKDYIFIKEIRKGEVMKCNNS